MRSLNHSGLTLQSLPISKSPPLRFPSWWELGFQQIQLRESWVADANSQLSISLHMDERNRFQTPSRDSALWPPPHNYWWKYWFYCQSLLGTSALVHCAGGGITFGKISSLRAADSGLWLEAQDHRLYWSTHVPHGTRHKSMQVGGENPGLKYVKAEASLWTVFPNNTCVKLHASDLILIDNWLN